MVKRDYKVGTKIFVARLDPKHNLKAAECHPDNNLEVNRKEGITGEIAYLHLFNWEGYCNVRYQDGLTYKVGIFHYSELVRLDEKHNAVQRWLS